MNEHINIKMEDDVRWSGKRSIICRESWQTFWKESSGVEERICILIKIARGPTTPPSMVGRSITIVSEDFHTDPRSSAGACSKIASQIDFGELGH